MIQMIQREYGVKNTRSKVATAARTTENKNITQTFLEPTLVYSLRKLLVCIDCIRPIKPIPIKPFDPKTNEPFYKIIAITSDGCPS